MKNETERGIDEWNASVERVATKRLRDVSTEALRLLTVATGSARYPGRTPVDTGRTKGNWRVSVGTTPSREFQWNLYDKTGTKTFSVGSGKIRTANFGDDVNISNSTPYIVDLEFPPFKSRQAPAGFLRVTCEELQTKADAGII